ncbi:helicase-associated domain-containing protein [Paenibacillus piscarius]|uniref:helicase-associated domain-containing protein n=1 Tax=Paenibacillus piscarius TaxID=1089681 RepID=UPI001EE94DB3|nr:helicase-associated domain-containing protein [Paenibacillus piscarius]
MGVTPDAGLPKLTPEACEVLLRICASYAASPCPADTVEQLRPESLCRMQQKLALEELLLAGQLELRQKVWGEKLYQIPQDQYPVILRSFWSECPQVRVEGRVHVEAAACTELAAELFRALLFTSEEGLPLTSKGVIHKKQLARLAGQLSVKEEYLRAVLPPSSRQESYPLPVTILVDLMLALGLISRHGSGYRIDPEKLEQWLLLRPQEMTDLLYTLAIRRYGFPAPAEQHFRHVISAAVYPAGEWFALAPVLEWMAESGLAAEKPEVNMVKETKREKEVEENASGLELSALAWLRLLAGFGWCELGVSPSGEPCFRWRAGKPQLALEGAAGQDSVPADTAPGFIVQPDFEVLVPPEVPYADRWTLAGFAELLHNEDLWSFRLTREKLEAAAEQGAAPGGLIDWLDARAVGGIPEQVLLPLRQWAGGIGRTRLAEVLLLSCAGEREAEDIAAHPRLQDIVTRIGPLHYTVRPEAAGQLRKELAAAGMTPSVLSEATDSTDRRLFLTGTPASPQASLRYRLPQPAADRGLLSTAPQLALLPLERAVQPQTQLPGEDAVPQMWFSQWRKYHSTTAQKIMEQAFSWGIKVSLSYEGRQAEFIPGQISGRPWRVRGILLLPASGTAEEKELTAEDWQEMKLIHPYQHVNSSSAEAVRYGMMK